MRQKSFLFLCILICLVAAPALFADEAVETTPAAQAVTLEQQDVTPDEPETLQPSLDEILNDSTQVEASVSCEPCFHAFNCARYCYENFGSEDGICDGGCCVCF